MPVRSEQEEFWRGEFGNAFTTRNHGRELVEANIALFSRALRSVGSIDSCIEFGSNIGLNLLALKQLFPEQDQFSVEINPLAARRVRQVIGDENVFEGSIVEYPESRLFDLVLVKGVLIHADPASLPQIYDKIADTSERLVMMCEYYNRTPVSIPYRGHENKLFKRDFCGEFLDRRTEFDLIDYGFVYHRDANFPQDDATWFLLERRRRGPV